MGEEIPLHDDSETPQGWAGIVAKGVSEQIVNDVPDFEDVKEVDEGVMSDDESDEGKVYNAPHLELSKEERRGMRKGWRNALIVKLLRKDISHRFMAPRLQKLWNLSGRFSVVDIGCGFYVVRFALKTDYDKVMEGGPWMLSDHYLTIQTWKSYFRSEFEKSSDTMMIWVRFPGLPIEFYSKPILWKMGDMIGETKRIDKVTQDKRRGRIARVAVQMNLKKPLLAKIHVKGDYYQPVAYEGLHMICLRFGIYGHTKDTCSLKEKGQNEHAVDADQNKEGTASEGQFGEWMCVPKRQGRRGGGPQKNAIDAGGGANGVQGLVGVQGQGHPTEYASPRNDVTDWKIRANSTYDQRNVSHQGKNRDESRSNVLTTNKYSSLVDLEKDDEEPDQGDEQRDWPTDFTLGDAMAAAGGFKRRQRRGVTRSQKEKGKSKEIELISADVTTKVQLSEPANDDTRETLWAALRETIRDHQVMRGGNFDINKQFEDGGTSARNVETCKEKAREKNNHETPPREFQTPIGENMGLVLENVPPAMITPGNADMDMEGAAALLVDCVNETPMGVDAMQC